MNIFTYIFKQAFLLAVFLFTASAYALGTTSSLSPVGTYKTAPGKAGETNSLSISAGDSGKYEVAINTVYCAYAAAPDCSNAKFGELNFKSHLVDGQIVYQSQKTTCSVKIMFSADSAIVEQSGTCETVPYDNASGVYKK